MPLIMPLWTGSLASCKLVFMVTSPWGPYRPPEALGLSLAIARESCLPLQYSRATNGSQQVFSENR